MSGKERKTDPLPILGEDGAVFQYGDPQRIPPQGSNKSQSRRTPTPTKQVSLKAVSRRGDSPECEDFVDMEELRQSLSRENSRIFEPKEEEKVIHGANSKSTRRGHRCSHGDGYEKPFVVPSKAPKPQQKSVKAPPKVVEKKPPPEGAEGGKEDSSSSDSEEEEEEERKAPSELLMEFLECLMKKEYTVAAKLCKMILIYEPNHATALQFQPVLEDKIRIEEEKENESGSDESGDDESDDSGEESDSDDDDEEDDDDDDKSESSDSDREEERNSADEFFDEFKQDSGIASASSD